MKIVDNVVKFAHDIDAYKAFADLYNHQRAINGATNVDYDKTLTFEEKSNRVHNAMMKEISAKSGVPLDGSCFAAEVMATNPMVKWAAFAVVGAMVDLIIPQTIVDTFGLYTDVKTGGFGDSFSFEIKPRDLFVVSKAGRGNRRSEIHKQFDGQVTVVPVEHDITVQASLYKVLAGKESLAEFALKAARSIETQMTVDCYNAFNDLVTNLPTTPTGGELNISGYSQDSLVKLCQRVTAYNQGAKAVIVATQVAASKILPTDTNNNYRIQIDSEYVKVGYVQTAFGYDVMILPQVADWQNPFKTLLADDRLYIMSPSTNKLVKLCIEGSTISITDDAYANANLTQNTTMKKMWAASVSSNAVVGVVRL
jgi:hypothetical protein